MLQGAGDLLSQQLAWSQGPCVGPKPHPGLQEKQHARLMAHQL